MTLPRIAKAAAAALALHLLVPAPVAFVVAPASAAEQTPTKKGERKILYYRNPMGLPDTSPMPKKDSMGMDYIAVYEDEASDESGTVRISASKIQTLGVRTEAVTARPMTRTIRAVGRVAFDERKIGVVSPRFEGWITKLHVDTTGATIERGEALFTVYSPDLALAEQEYLIARNAGEEIAAAALSRLRNWEIPADEIAQLKRTGIARDTVKMRARAGGIVVEKTALEGMRFAPGDTLYRVVDLTSVWILADVFEQDLASVHVGDPADASVAAYPGRTFAGTVAFVYPTTDQATRTTKVRIELANPELLLKGDMYATVDIAAPGSAGRVLALPASAVLDNGRQQTVLIDRGEGRFEPRQVKLGARANDYVEIVDGVAAGEKAVVGANFLIDAESNLRAALQAFTAPAEEAKKP